MNLAEMADAVREVNEANGWHDDSRTFGDEVALLHSEVSEMLEEFREHGADARLLRFEGGEGFVQLPEDDPNAKRWQEAGYHGKPIGVASEAADILIRLLDTCGRYGIDLEAEFHKKLAYNRTRGHRHGGKKL